MNLEFYQKAKELYPNHVFDDYLICPVSGRYGKKIDNRNLAKIGYTIEQFKNEFPGFPTICQISADSGISKSHQTLRKINQKRKEEEIKQYNQNPNKCQHCGKDLPYEKKANKFCNQSCAATFNNTGSKCSEEHKKKTSASLKGRKSANRISDYKYISVYFHTCKKCRKIFASIYKKQSKCDICCNLKEIEKKRKSLVIKNAIIPEFDYTRVFYQVCECCGKHYFWKSKKKTCCKKCQNKMASERQSAYLKANPGKYAGRRKKSYMEQSFINWLINNGINQGYNGWYNEIHFINPNTGKNGWIDFLFPKKKLIIELDGSHHKKRQHLDKIRDSYLISKGWKIIRVSHSEYTKKKRINEIKFLLGIK